MSKRIKVLVGLAGAAVLLAVALVGNALAQPPTPSSRAPQAGIIGGCHGDPQAMWGAIAAALRLSPEALQAQLESGQTLLDVAKAQGLDETQFGEAMFAAMADFMQDRVEQGDLTQAELDAMLETMKSHMTPDQWAAMSAMMSSGGMGGMMSSGGMGGMMRGGMGSGGMMGGSFNRPSGGLGEMMRNWRSF